MPLTSDQATVVWRDMLAVDPSLSTFCTKLDLQALIETADAWLSDAFADDIVLQMADAMPEPWKSAAAPAQKQALMAALIAMRALVDPAESV